MTSGCAHPWVILHILHEDGPARGRHSPGDAFTEPDGDVLQPVSSETDPGHGCEPVLLGQQDHARLRPHEREEPCEHRVDEFVGLQGPHGRLCHLADAVEAGHQFVALLVPLLQRAEDEGVGSDESPVDDRQVHEEEGQDLQVVPDEVEQTIGIGVEGERELRDDGGGDGRDEQEEYPAFHGAAAAIEEPDGHEQHRAYRVLAHPLERGQSLTVDERMREDRPSEHRREGAPSTQRRARRRRPSRPVFRR